MRLFREAITAPPAGGPRLLAEQQAPHRQPAALTLDGLAHNFGQRWVLRGVALEVAAGEAVALMGRNGSGKTTLLRIVATALRPARGGGSVFGLDLRRDAPIIRERVGSLGHAAALYDDLTATENLRFAVRMRGEPDDAAAIRAALAEVGLASEHDNRVRGFSAGMRRRLALARLVLHPPNLLLLDEPYASFDEDGIQIVNRMVRATALRGGAVLLVTHDLARATGAVHRVLRLEEGRILPLHAPDIAAAAPHRRAPADPRRNGRAVTA
jgi:heme exporter protein A